jgi:hypothetical protein
MGVAGHGGRGGVDLFNEQGQGVGDRQPHLLPAGPNTSKPA